MDTDIKRDRGAPGGAASADTVFRFGAELVCEPPFLDGFAFCQGTLDALSANIAVLDAEGVVLKVNRSWREFAANGGHDPLGGVGTNYLHHCRIEDETGRSAGWGIEDVLRGKRIRFELEYPCHGPSERRWFTLRATRFILEGRVYCVVSREDITQRVLAEKELKRERIRSERLDAVLKTVRHLRHEINNPLQAILGTLELMAVRLDALPDNGKLTSHHARLTAAAQCISDVTDRMAMIREEETEDAHGVEMIRLPGESLHRSRGN